MLYIHTSNHLEKLKEHYADLVKAPLHSVLKKETVVVQNAGMARWLSIEMADTLGISANTEYLFPAEYMWRLLRLVSPGIPEHSQCAPDTLRFHIYQELTSRPEHYPELEHYIFNGLDPSSNKDTKSTLNDFSIWELSCQTARLLDQYLFYRDEWIQAWEQNSVSESLSNTNQKSNHPIDHWQARIWNNCVKDKGLMHWLMLQEQFKKNIESIDETMLEERVSFFSMSALSPGYIDLLAAVSQKTDIHIFIINPCADAYWGDIQSPKAYSKLDQTNQVYSDIGNPLLASMGKQGQDFIDKLISIQDQGLSEDYVDSSHHDNHKYTTLLSSIQQGIHDLREPELISSFHKNDTSIEIHSCHTVMREVEVLHDQILNQLDNDERLGPKDIVVMMPDIEKYAPYIESVFSGSLSDKNKKTLPYSIADRDPQNIFKIVQALNKLFCLRDSRFDSESVLELLEYDDIRTHFGIDQEQFNYCRELTLATNVRWGISDRHRQQQGLPNTEEHTWKYALDRMLLGYTLSVNDSTQNQLFESKRHLKLLPYNEIEGSNALVLAKFKKFTDTVFTVNEWQNKHYSIKLWLEKTITLIKQISPESADQERILKTLADVETKSHLAEFEQEIPFSVFQKILHQSLSEISANEKYLGYGITFCALVPMRSVPFKLVVLLGMNDGEFPRQDTSPSFDLMAHDKQKGDRSRRDEDRYLFLESLLAARQKLIISYIGQSIKDNTELAPSILVSELLDTIEIYSGYQAKEWIIKHPLQAFNSRYFRNDRVADNANNQQLFTYAGHYIKTQLKYSKESTAINSTDKSQAFITKALPTISDEFKNISLIDLINFFKNPSYTFLKNRFEMDNDDYEKDFKIREPFSIEAFKENDIRQIVLTEDCSDKKMVARAKGLLPYGKIGESVYSKEKHITETFIQSLTNHPSLDNISFILNFDTFDLHGVIDQLTNNGRVINSLKQPFAGDYIQLWIEHLCMNAYINRNQKHDIPPLTQYYSPEISFQLNPVENAEEQLAILLEYFWNGLHWPLVFFPKTAFAMYRKKGKPSLNDMRTKWHGNDHVKGERESFEHWLLHRNILLDQEQPNVEFMQSSEAFFGQLFNSLTDL